LGRGDWKVKPILFVEIIEEKIEDDDLQTVYSCGYWKSRHSNGIGFKNRDMKKGCHHNLHQVIHCLNKYRGIPFEKISIECGFYDSKHSDKFDVLAEINSEKYIVVELGYVSSYDKFWWIYEPYVEEIWFDAQPFDGSRKYFYSLSANNKSQWENLSKDRIDSMRDYFREKCSKDLGQFWNCGRYSKELCTCHLL